MAMREWAVSSRRRRVSSRGCDERLVGILVDPGLRTALTIGVVAGSPCQCGWSVDVGGGSIISVEVQVVERFLDSLERPDCEWKFHWM
jgi:hypothetical protein